MWELERTVMKVNLDCYKWRRVALQSITLIEGIEMISINKEQTITVEGEADPVWIANQLKRKFKCATIIFVGPPPKPPEPIPKPDPVHPCKSVQRCCCSDCSSSCYVPRPGRHPRPVQPCCCSDCYARWEIPRTGCHPPQPHTEVYYVYNEENHNPCTFTEVSHRIEMISINVKEQTITVEGDAHPVSLENQLKKKFKCAAIISVGPPPKPPEPEPKPPKPEPKPKPPEPKPHPCKCVQPCRCSDCSSRCYMPPPGCHPPQPHTEVCYVYNEENPCTIS